jgi:hypothetical protein
MYLCSRFKISAKVVPCKELDEDDDVLLQLPIAIVSELISAFRR